MSIHRARIIFPTERREFLKLSLSSLQRLFLICDRSAIRCQQRGESFPPLGQTPCQPRGQEGAQKRAWVRGWHIARLGRYGREIIWKCHASYPSDTELFFYAAIKFKIFYNKRIYLTTSTKDSYKRSKGADICSRNGVRVIKLGGRQTERTKPEIRSVPLLNCPFLHFGK